MRRIARCLALLFLPLAAFAEPTVTDADAVVTELSVAEPTVTETEAAIAAPGNAPSEVEALPYARTDSDGTTIARGKSWYLEEYDGRSRPICGTLWVGGAIARLTKWLYADDSQQAVTRIDTEGDVVTETGYDRFGNKTHVYVTGPDGAAISAEDNVWGEDRQLLESTTVSGKTTLRTVNTYDADGALIERNLYKNGALISRVVYIDRDNWTETVYHAGSAVLVTAYRNGTRVKNENSQ